MYLRELRLRDLRCFREAEMRFSYPPEGNFTLLLGNNGAGKTTVLKAAAMAVLAPLMAGSSGFVPFLLVRSGCEEAKVEGEFADSSSFSVGIFRAGEGERLGPLRGLDWEQDRLKTLYGERGAEDFVVGYGATRRVQDGEFSGHSLRKRRHLRYQRVAGLFEPYVELMPLELWFASSPRREEVVELMNRLLPEELRFDGEFVYRGLRLPFEALSDGYRAYVAWVSDLLYHLAQAADGRMEELAGLVLVDELDLHLHPEWQRKIVGTLQRGLPRLQFIVTSHSPLIAGSLESRFVRVMKVGEDGTAMAVEPDRQMFGMDAQQVLVSPLFGLDSTRAAGAQEELKTLAREATAENPEKVLELMRRLSGRLSER
ncbi:MAG: AAA family ATPase [Acidobacteria bacterium]|nr:AAA family ATPase [Bryobacteraceae bacterium CoA2 C42]